MKKVIKLCKIDKIWLVIYFEKGKKYNKIKTEYKK